MHLRELRRHAGRFVIVGFSDVDEVRRLARAFDIGGVIYSPGNLVEPRQIADLSRELGEFAVDWPLWISVEHEGATTDTLPAPFTPFPAPCALGRSGDETLARRYGSALASELNSVGINLNYGPVLDIATASSRPMSSDHALADREDITSRLGRAIVRAVQEAGVAACARHFPGCGSAVSQGNDEPPIVDESPDKLRTVDLRPFSAAIDEKIAAVTIGMAQLPALDEAAPAPLSRTVVNGMLKQECGFTGIAVADLTAVGGFKANGRYSSSEHIAVGCIRAGCDVLLIRHGTLDERVDVIEAIIRAGESGGISPTRVEDAWTRQRRAKERFAWRTPTQKPSSLDVVGCLAHQRVADEMRQWL